ncbi:MAG: RidA family protein [Lentisphaerae bacterium]|nr:RidA family protein [Lentisphaerota bacterium]
MIKAIATELAPAAIGPYSQAIATESTIFCSGQLPIDPATGKIMANDIAEQTRQVLGNMAAVLGAVDLTLAAVVKTTVFMADLQDFAAMNTVYQECFGAHAPARSTVQVARLPLDARIEIECIAVRT